MSEGLLNCSSVQCIVNRSASKNTHVMYTCAETQDFPGHGEGVPPRLNGCMQRALKFQGSEAMPEKVIAPLIELGAYEWLWQQDKASFKTLAERFAAAPGWLPSDFVDSATALETGKRVVSLFRERGIERFGVRIHRAGEYPKKLREARHPVELLYYSGVWDITEFPAVSVVGTRHPSVEGLRRARKLAKLLVGEGWTVVSGLAAGIDTAAHNGALDAGGRTVAVLGTPLSETYPAENAELQKRIAREHLVISQVPLLRYTAQRNPKANRFFFPERNVTMSALTKATIIVEASNTSGTRTQARAALQQGGGRKLFILDSCFQNPELTWPKEFEAQGAIRVSDFKQITDVLGPASDEGRRPIPW
jgi:DNA processing protein